MAESTSSTKEDTIGVNGEPSIIKNVVFADKKVDSRDCSSPASISSKIGMVGQVNHVDDMITPLSPVSTTAVDKKSDDGSPINQIPAPHTQESQNFRSRKSSGSSDLDECERENLDSKVDAEKSHDRTENSTAANTPQPNSDQSSKVPTNSKDLTMDEQKTDSKFEEKGVPPRDVCHTVGREKGANPLPPKPQSIPNNDPDAVAEDIVQYSKSTKTTSQRKQTQSTAAKLPPRLTSLKKSDVKQRVLMPTKSSTRKVRSPLPQSQQFSSIDDCNDSAFGPFVEVMNNDDWNPFGSEGAPNGEMFQVDEDNRLDGKFGIEKNDQQTKSNGANDAVQLERSQSTLSKQAAEAELDGLRRIFDSEYERALQDQEIAWKAKYAATRWSFILSAICMILYLWLGCMFYRSEAGWSVPDALLFTVYTVTTVGYGGPQPLPNTAAFHAFTSMYVLVGISGVTVLGAHTYQLVTLETTRIRSSPLHKRRARSPDAESGQDDLGEEEGNSAMAKRRRQFMNELEDRVREQPFLDVALDYFIDRFKEFRVYLRTTKSGRAIGVMLPFLGMILLGAVVVGPIEGWTPLESIYWSIVTLTTVGYGDYVPTQDPSVWFCTLFFIPSSLFFLSFFLAHVAKSYIGLHAIHVTRLERQMRRKIERRRTETQRSEQAKQNADGSSSTDVSPSLSSPRESSPMGNAESGFTTISYTEDEDLANGVRNDNGIGNSAQLFGDIESSHNNTSSSLASPTSPGLRYRENVIRNKLTAPDPDGRRTVSFAEALQSLNKHCCSRSFEGTGADEQARVTSSEENKETMMPSLDIRLRVQERLARIIAEEIAGFQSGVIIKGSTVSLTVSTLRDTAEKWKIPPQAWKAFRAVAFRSLLFVGERDLISDGGDALLRLNAIEFHGIFSPMLAAMGDGSSMEEWLGVTDILADVELRREYSVGGRKDSLARENTVFNGTFT